MISTAPLPPKRNAAFIGSPEVTARVFGHGRFDIVADLTTLFPQTLTQENLPLLAPDLPPIEVLFSTWGMPALSVEEIALLPHLKAVFYAAGSVQFFARPFLESGIEVFSAWAANAVPVAQWTLAQILLANKGFGRNLREFSAARSPVNCFRGRGNFGATISILGAGQIGRLVCELLKPFGFDVAVFDPFLDDEGLKKLGARRLNTLEEAFSQGAVVSNHLANLQTTVGMLGGEHFALMPPQATFINTGRGATVREDEMIAVLQRRPDLTALLDVTHPEPPLKESPLWTMENVFLTSHLAGSIGDEVVRMADYMVEDFRAWNEGLPTQWGVNLAMLETMA